MLKYEFPYAALKTIGVVENFSYGATENSKLCGNVKCEIGEQTIESDET